jgi:hypothetical protein
MKIKKPALAVALAAGLAMGASQQASANIYAGSGLQIENLTVNITGFAPGTAITTFQFNATNTASLNGVSAPTQNASCGGTPGPGGTTNDCNPAPPRLDPAAATLGPAPAGFVFGPINAEYSTSDSVIRTAALTLDAFTSTQQIAQSELISGKSASANAEITSTTGFSFVFTVTNGGGLVLDFDADPFLRALINEPAFQSGSALANINASFSLTDASGDEITWTPSGSLANDCTVDSGFGAGTATCTENNDSQDLNRNLSVSANGQDVPYSPLTALTDFGITIAGLSDGTYTFGLNAVTSTTLQRRFIPEPGILALFGIGLMGIVASTRRRKIV